MASPSFLTGHLTTHEHIDFINYASSLPRPPDLSNSLSRYSLLPVPGKTFALSKHLPNTSTFSFTHLVLGADSICLI
jgi:hypothetical protein